MAKSTTAAQTSSTWFVLTASGSSPASQIPDAKTAVLNRAIFVCHHVSVVIDLPANSTSTVVPSNARFTFTTSRKLFNNSTTYLPSLASNAIARTPFLAPDVPILTAPGLTNLLKCARYQYVPV